MYSKSITEALKNMASCSSAFTEACSIHRYILERAKREDISKCLDAAEWTLKNRMRAVQISVDEFCSVADELRERERRRF